MSKVKVLEGILPKGTSGKIVYIMELFRHMDPEKFDFTFLIESKDSYFEKEILARGGHIRVITPRRVSLAAHRRDLKKVFAEGYDVCHIHLSTASNIESIKLAKKAGVPVVIAHSHNCQAEGGIVARTLHAINVPILGKLDIVRLTCAKPSGYYMFGKAPFIVMNNAVDLERFAYRPEVREKMRRELQVEDQFVVGNVARFMPVKNHPFLLKIFKEVLRKCPKSRLLLVGDGQERANIEALASEMGIRDKVIFTGNVPNPQDYMNAMDCMVMPSLFEGFPLTIVEGVNAGLPIYAADTITDEIAVFPHVSFFSLKKPPEEAAKLVLGAREIPRQGQTQAVIDAGFRMEDGIRKMENIYLGR